MQSFLSCSVFSFRHSDLDLKKIDKVRAIPEIGVHKVGIRISEIQITKANA